MRGLPERVAYAQEKVALMFAPDQNNDRMADIFHDAIAQGIADYQQGRVDAPVLYRDVPLLMRGWDEGQAFAVEAEEMNNCPGCNDDNLPICPFHG